MSDQPPTIECGEHGRQEATFVCQHIVQGLRDGEPCGFWWAQDHDRERPDAWCTACNEMVGRAGGEWTEEAEAIAGVTLLCAACYDRARRQNGL